MPETVTYISTFSDTRAGQNRNNFIVAAMLYAVQKVENIKTVDLKYMESGDSYLEADSIHSAIESSKCNQSIYTTTEWEILIKACRRKPRHYVVTVLKHSDFYDIKDMAKKTVKNTSKSDDGQTVKWLRIKWFRFEKAEPNVVKYKYNLSSPEFHRTNINNNGIPVSWPLITLSSAYSSRQSISVAKKKYLVDLLKNWVISEDYAQFDHKQPSTYWLPAHLEQEFENEEENCEDDIHETAASNEPPPVNADENVSDETHLNYDIPTIVTIELCKHLTSGDSNGCKRLLCPAVSESKT